MRCSQSRQLHEQQVIQERWLHLNLKLNLLILIMMLRNYLLVAFRNLLKNRVFTIINIIGLGIALSVCIVVFFNNMFSYEFDKTHLNFDQIYRVNSLRDMQGREQEYGIAPATLDLEIKEIKAPDTDAFLVGGKHRRAGGTAGQLPAGDEAGAAAGHAPGRPGHQSRMCHQQGCD
jgi:hypothetical protein